MLFVNISQEQLENLVVNPTTDQLLSSFQIWHSHFQHDAENNPTVALQVCVWEMYIIVSTYYHLKGKNEWGYFIKSATLISMTSYPDCYSYTSTIFTMSGTICFRRLGGIYARSLSKGLIKLKCLGDHAQLESWPSSHQSGIALPLRSCGNGKLSRVSYGRKSE